MSGHIQKLTLEGVRRAARKYFRAGKLMAQHPVKSHRNCVYVRGDYRCGIGAALTKHTLVQILNSGQNAGAAVARILGESMIVSLPDSANERHNIFDIQSKHDEWCNASRTYGAATFGAREAKRMFARAIGIKS